MGRFGRFRMGKRFAPVAADTVPVVSNSTFSVTDAFVDGQYVGAVSFSGSPSPALSITAGNTGSAFAINSSTGVITVADETELVPGNNYSLTVQGTNVAGSDTGTITINVSAATINDMTPTTWDLSNAHDETIFRKSYTGGIPPVIWTPAELRAARLVWPVESLNGFTPEAGTISYTYPGGLDWPFNNGFSGPGERQEIGPLTQAAAEWLLGGSPDAMLNQGLGAGACPYHIYDTVDGVNAPGARIINTITSYQASVNSGGSPSPFFDLSGQAVEPDDAHHGSFAYTAYQATRDPRYLLEVQHAGAFAMLINGTWNYHNPPGALFPWQTRGVAWMLRNIFEAYVATPEGTVPAPFLPKSHFKDLMDINRDKILSDWVTTQNFHSARPGVQTFIQNTGFIEFLGDYGGGIDTLSPWHMDYLGCILGWIMWYSDAHDGVFEDWRPIYEFARRQVVQRLTGALKSRGITYGINDGTPGSFPNFTTAVDMTDYIETAHATPSGDGHTDPANELDAYRSYAYGNLEMQVRNGYTDADTLAAREYICDEILYYDGFIKKYGLLKTVVP